MGDWRGSKGRLLLVAVGEIKIPSDKQNIIIQYRCYKPCISPELGGLNASINSTECGLETSALPFAFKRSRSPTEWWCTLVILVTFAWSAIDFAFNALFWSSESCRRHDFMYTVQRATAAWSYQRKTQAIPSPVYFRQIIFERICYRWQQIRGWKYLHTTGGALVATRRCVGRQAGLTCIQAVPVKHVWKCWQKIYKFRFLTRLGSKSLTVAHKAYTFPLLECSSTQSAVGYIVAIPQPLQIRLHYALFGRNVKKIYLRTSVEWVMHIPWDGSGPYSARRHWRDARSKIGLSPIFLGICTDPLGWVYFLCLLCDWFVLLLSL